MSRDHQTEVFVLANHSPERTFVRWYHSREGAEALFEAAVSAGDHKEDVLLFSLMVADELNHEEIRKQAEKAVRDGVVEALRTYFPEKRGSNV